MTKKKLGRPAFYKSASSLQEKIDQYFTQEVGIEILKDQEGKPLLGSNGKPIFDVKAPTVAGLSLFLGFCDRRSLYDYGERPDFSHAIKKAISRIEAFAEQCLLTGAKPVGAIFWLKNHGWQDRTEHTGKDGTPLMSPPAVNYIFVNPENKNEECDPSRL